MCVSMVICKGLSYLILTHLLGQREEVLMQGEHCSIKGTIMCVSWDHTRVFLHAVPVPCRNNKVMKNSFKQEAFFIMTEMDNLWLSYLSNTT